MGLIVKVYSAKGDNYDCTLNGVTNRFTELCVINVDGPFEPNDNCPAVELLPGAMNGIAILRPVGTEGNCVMFGGNYAAISDSRFSRAVEKVTGNRFYGAVPVHDRIEC